MKSILQILTFIILGSTACAQGTISISSPADSVQYVYWWNFTPVNVPANGGFVSVLWAPTGAPTSRRDPLENLTQWLARNPAWDVVTSDGGMPFIKAITYPGRLLSTGLTVPTMGAVDLIVVGWTGPFASFDAAYVGSWTVPPGSATGFSEVIQHITPAGIPTPPTVVTLQSLTLFPPPIPEPSALTLAGVAVLALLVSRREKLKCRQTPFCHSRCSGGAASLKLL